MMRVVNGHKGCSQFRTVVTGIPAHSSETEQGVSAVEIAARLIGSIAAMRAANRRRAAPDSPFSPPYSSLAAHLVQGGTQQNLMAGACRLRWDVRLLPGQDLRTILAPSEPLTRHLHADMRAIGPTSSTATAARTHVPTSPP